jgi:AhpD family alkylhydroperoxidase
MRTVRWVWVAALVAAFPSWSAARSEQAQAALNDIQKTLGFVPAFLRALPDAALPGAWEEMKMLEMGQSTALQPKVKELIGLAVASQIPCRYCVLAHTEFAKGNGATPADLGLAIAESGLTRHWSTFLNGVQMDDQTFRAEMTKMLDAAKQMDPNAPSQKPTMVTDADAAYNEMQRMFGFVPQFMKQFPANAIPGAWMEMRDVEMMPHQNMPPKVLSLVGLGVAAQIPCRYCIAYETDMAKAQGATDEEINEALAMAAHTRNFSTLLNGLQINEATFKADIARMTRGKGKLASR